MPARPFVAQFVSIPCAHCARHRGRFSMFAIDDIDTTGAGRRARGAELVGEVAQYQDSYRLCYVRGPGGIIVALAEQPS